MKRPQPRKPPRKSRWITCESCKERFWASPDDRAVMRLACGHLCLGNGTQRERLNAIMRQIVPAPRRAKEEKRG